MRTRLEAELARVEPALFHLDADLTGVIDRLDGDDLDLVGDGLVRAIAADLQSRAGNPDDPERVVAALALRKLLRMATRIGGGETASRSSPRTPDEGSPAAVIHPFAAMATVPDEVALRPSPPSESRRRKSA